jgi:DNA-binding NtrC family response regulator
MGSRMQQSVATGGQNGAGMSRVDLKALLQAYERSLILEALEASGGHQRRTAARLGILPTTLHEKMKRLGLLQRRAAASSTVVASGATATGRDAVRGTA